MLFNSLHFLLFLPIVVLFYYLISHRYRWMLIFISSCYFYMAFVPKYILILFLIIVIDFFAAKLIHSAQGSSRKFYLILSLIANLSLLAFFKYFNFLNENLVSVFNLFGKDFHSINLNIILPIGLSFHTFQSMSYTIEVYRGNQEPETHLGYFANYVLFFPQMVAGPIERYSSLGEELKKRVEINYSNFSNGFRLILFGLLIKMAIADNIAPLVNEVYGNYEKYNSFSLLIGVVLFAFQIYSDFFGYSTIAIGAAKLLGISIMDNFKNPFSSISITEFWRRWHISLSTWFNQYLFTPFATASRNLGAFGIVLGLLITFFLSGLWHGAGWNFAIYGLLHGIALSFEFLTKKIRAKFFSFLPNSIHKIIGIVICFLFVAMSWIFFRAETFDKAITISKSILLFSQQGEFLNFNALVIPIIAGISLVILDIWLLNSRIDKKIETYKFYHRWALYAVFVFSLMALSGTQKFNFIYFQF